MVLTFIWCFFPVNRVPHWFKIMWPLIIIIPKVNPLFIYYLDSNENLTIFVADNWFIYKAEDFLSSLFSLPTSLLFRGIIAPGLN